MDIYNEEKEDLKEHVIYKITNLINMKCYVGRTCDFDRRMKEHQRGNLNSKGIHGAINKYGWNNFTSEVLEYCIGDKLTAEREKCNIWLYESFGSLGYNLTSGGENYIVSEETRRIQSENRRGEKHPQFGRIGEMSHNFGLKRSQETIQKLIDNHVGMSGKSHTEDTKVKIGKANSGNKNGMCGRSGELSPSYGKTGEEHPAYGCKHSKESIEKRAEKRRKQFLVTFPDGHTEITNNLQQFCKDHNLCRSCMINVANGRKNPIHKGFKCEHYNENNEVK